MSIAVDSNSWHAKWFRYSNAVWRTFGLDYSNVYRTSSTTVCHYLRTIIVYVPVVVALHIVTIGCIILTFIVYPLTAFGLVSYSIVIGVIASVALMIWLILSMADIYHKNRYGKTKRDKSKFASLGSLVWEYVKGVKQKVCPIIDLKGKLND